MTQKWILAILLGLFFYTLQAKDYDPIEDNPIVNFVGAPSALVNGSVNVITGDYTEFCTDMSIPGPEPLTFERSYVSSDSYRGSLCQGWNKNHHGTLEMSYKRVQININEKEGYSYELIGDTSNYDSGLGVRMNYEKQTSSQKDSIQYRINKNLYNSGLTNISRGEISGRTNHKNDWIVCKKTECKAIITDGSGTTSIFKEHAPTLKNIYLHKQTIKPNRLRLRYNYDENLKQIRVILKGSQDNPISSMEFFVPPKDQFDKDPHFIISGSNGRKVRYNYVQTKKHGDKDHWYLKEVIKDSGPHESYVYEKYYSKHDHENMRMVRKNLPDNRFMEIEYYKKKKNKSLKDSEFLIKSNKDCCKHKVKLQKEPVGTDKTPIKTYSYAYQYDEKKNSGFTIVKNAYEVPTRYEYLNNRLTEIHHYLDKSQKYRIEKFYWGAKGVFYEGNLMSSVLCDSQSNIQMSRTNYYDSHGNVIVERLFGNLSGKSSAYLAMMSDGTPDPNDCEYDQKLYTYSNDGLNLCLTESHQNTLITYTYHPQTNLIVSKLTSVDGTIVERQFFDYDLNGVLIQEISDDGSGGDKEDLKAITQRKITYITPAASPIGYPAEIANYVLDRKTGREIFLKRTVNSYSAYGDLLQQETYDSLNDLAATKRWSYDTMGNLLEEMNALGEITTYRYDANKNKIFEQGPRSDVHKEFVYDYSNRLVAEKEIFQDGTQLVKQFKYDYLGNKVSETDIYGNETTFAYDGLNRLVQIKKPTLINFAGQEEKQIQSFDYNIFNAIICRTDAFGRQTHLTTNIRGQPTSIRHPDGTEEHFKYGLDGTLAEHIETQGLKTCTEYDYQKRPLKKSVYAASGEFLFATTSTYSAYGILTETDAAGTLSTFDYDDAGRLICKKKGEIETRFEYDSSGRIHKEISLLPNKDSITLVKLYDRLDRVIEERIENGLEELQSLTQTSYDTDGNKSSMITYGQSGASTLLQEFNAHGDLVRSVDAEGHVTVSQYRYDYVNAQGHHVGYRETTDPLGHVTVVIKNTHGKDCEWIKKNRFDQLLQRYRLYFDAYDHPVARVETVIHPDEGDRELITLWEYNNAHHLTRRVEAYGSSNQKEMLVHYNRLGQKCTVTKPDGVQVFYEYDAYGRLSRYYSSAKDIDYTYTYDVLNHPVVVQDQIRNVKSLRKYNINGHMIHETLANGLSMHYTYDAMGRQTAVKLPDGSGYTYEFSGIQLKRICRQNGYGMEAYAHQYLKYDLAGKVLSAKLIGNAGSAAYEYDLLNRFRRIEFKHWREVIAGFDEAGQLTEKFFEDLMGSSHDQFRYDDLYQLKSESGTVSHTYKNDSIYNRTAKDEYLYRLNVLNQILSDGQSSYHYDLNGCLIYKSSKNNEDQYHYDSLGRLVTILSGDQKTTYTYDETNRRLSKQVYHQKLLIHSENYLYQGKHEIGIVNSSGKITTLRILGNGLGAEIGAAVALEINDTTYAPLHDHQGNIVTLVDASTGKVGECYRYSAFGEEEIYNQDGQRLTRSLNPWRYCSKHHDVETGYIYFGQRYYDPKLGRWITPDPIGFSDGPNLYAYVHNNPLTHLDLWGEYTRRRQQEAYFGGVRKQKDERITWDHHYEKRVGGVQSSRYIATANTIIQPAQPNKFIGFCNGIMNSIKDAFESARHLSRQAGGYLVQGIHNASHGFLNDLLECFFGLNFYRGTAPAKLMQRQWDEFFATNSPDSAYLHFCHSQGAIHTRNALLDYPEELRKRIIVVAIAPAAYISPEICKSVDHYVSNRDFVPYFDLRGRAECRETIHYVKAHKHAKLWDHDFKSPTYKQIINFHTHDYLYEK